jgi:hypothetical protein
MLAGAQVRSEFNGSVLRVLRITTTKPLLAKDLDGKSDPYVVLWIGGDEASGAASSAARFGGIRTAVVSKSLSPVWEQKQIDPNALALTPSALELLSRDKMVLNVEVYDKDHLVDDHEGWSNAEISRVAPSTNGEKVTVKRAIDFNLVSTRRVDCAALQRVSLRSLMPCRVPSRSVLLYTCGPVQSDDSYTGAEKSKLKSAGQIRVEFEIELP